MLGQIRLIHGPQGAILCLVLKKQGAGWLCVPVEPNPRVRFVGDPVISGSFPLPQVSVAADLLRIVADETVRGGELWGRTEELEKVRAGIRQGVRSLAELSKAQRGEEADPELLLNLLPVFGDCLSHIRERRCSLARRFTACAM